MSWAQRDKTLQETQETIIFTDKRKSDHGGTLEKIKQPKTLFNRKIEFYGSEEVKENALASEGREKLICVSRTLSMKQL